MTDQSALRDLPDPSKVGIQSSSNKQMRDIVAEGDDRAEDIEQLETACRHSFAMYRALIERGWPRELARSILPMSTYSHMFASVDLLNLLKFLTLRCDARAQYEIRVYADAMRDLIRPVVPTCVAAWEGPTL